MQNKRNINSIQVRVPASTSNLGSGFDCCGLALQLYLTVRATVVPNSDVKCRVRTIGPIKDCLDDLRRDKDNLIYQSIEFLAEQEGFTLPPLRLSVCNEIPLASGLGSSAAAIIAGLKLGSAFARREIPDDRLLHYATQIEGHACNVAAALQGGFVLHFDDEFGHVKTFKKPWPSDLKIVIVTPHHRLPTKQARAILPNLVTTSDAIFNIQHWALFNAALDQGRYEFLWEAMQDRLHQPFREILVPGLREALATEQRDGLLGIALSGAGPSVIALTERHDSSAADSIAACFQKHGIATTIHCLGVENAGASLMVF